MLKYNAALVLSLLYFESQRHRKLEFNWNDATKCYLQLEKWQLQQWLDILPGQIFRSTVELWRAESVFMCRMKAFQIWKPHCTYYNHEYFRGNCAT